VRWVLAVCLLTACGTPAIHPLELGPLPAHPPTSLELERITAPAIATRPAVRVMVFDQQTETLPPPSSVAPAGLTACDEMRWYRQAAGLPPVFDTLGYRESRCRNGVRTWCCYGYWQLWVTLHLSDRRTAAGYAACGVTSAADVDSDTPADKRRQACATRVLYDVVGLSAW